MEHSLFTLSSTPSSSLDSVTLRSDSDSLLLSLPSNPHSKMRQNIKSRGSRYGSPSGHRSVSHLVSIGHRMSWYSWSRLVSATDPRWTSLVLKSCSNDYIKTRVMTLGISYSENLNLPNLRVKDCGRRCRKRFFPFSNTYSSICYNYDKRKVTSETNLVNRPAFTVYLCPDPNH